MRLLLANRIPQDTQQQPNPLNLSSEVKFLSELLLQPQKIDTSWNATGNSKIAKVCTKMQTTQQANAYGKMLSTSALEDAVNKCIRILPKMFFKFLGAQLTNKLWTRFPPDSHLHRRKNLLHLASHAQQLQCKGYRGHLSKRSAPLQHSMEVGLSKLSEFLWQPTSMSTNKIKRVHRPTLTDSIVTILSINILGQSVSKHANVQKLRPQKCYLLDGFLALHFSIFPPLQPDVHKYWDSLTSM